MSSRYAEAKTCVFWNVEDCPIPSGLDPESVAGNIKLALAKKGHLGDQYDRFMRMNGDFFLWLLENGGESTNMMVISGDHSDFAQCLSDCKAAKHNILLAQPEDAPRRCSSCRMSVQYEWVWETLSAGGDPITRAP